MTQARIAKISISWIAAFVGILLVLHAPPLLAQAPSFRPAVNYGSGGYSPTAVALGDLNGDRILDAVVANQCADGYSCPDGYYVCFSSDNCSHGAVGVLLGNGDGTFRPAVTYETRGYLSSSVALGDLNGDGKLDLVVVNQCGAVPIDSDYNCPYATVDVMFGNGDGTFGPPLPSGLSGWMPVSVALGDLNGDGKPEIVVADLCNMPNKCSDEGCTCTAGSVEVPGGTYDSGARFARSVALGDVNRDGNLDVLVGNDGDVGLLLGNGNGTLQPAVLFSAGPYIAVADVNSDGKPDLIGAWSKYPSYSGMVNVLLGNGDGTFKPAVTYPSGDTFPRSLAVADVNGDGRPDLIVGQSAIGVLIGNGDGTFQPPITFDSGGVWNSSIAVGDLNKDGTPDLVVVNGNVGVLLNNSQTQKRTTATTLTSSPNPSIYGQKLIFMATVTTTGPVPPTGTVAFMWRYFTQTYTIGTATLNSAGVASLTKSNLNANLYPMTAVYRGDTNNLSSASAVVNQTVLQTTSAATIASSVNPSTVGQPITFTAKINSPTVIPSGPVTFRAGTTVLGTAQLSSGKATFTTSTLPAGSTVVKVTYNGNSNIKGSSASVTQTVQP